MENGEWTMETDNGEWNMVSCTFEGAHSHPPATRVPVHCPFSGSSMQRLMTRAWVEIDLGALVRNGERFARVAGVPLLPMVKADAYGLGAVRVAHALLPLKPWGFGVATID